MPKFFALLTSSLFCGLFLFSGKSLAQAAHTQMDTKEALYIDLPYGWHIDEQKKSSTMLRAQYLPNGQTGKTWQNMITINIFYGLSSTGLETFSNKLIQVSKKNCHTLQAKKKPLVLSNNHLTQQITLNCPQNNQNQGYVKSVKVIQGKQNLYVIQRLWQGYSFAGKSSPVTTITKNLWGSYLNNVKVCQASKTKSNCPSILKESALLGPNTQVYSERTLKARY